MGSFYDSKGERNNGKQSLPTSSLDPQMALAILAAMKQRREITPYYDLDADVDLVWGALGPGQKPPSTYFDYFFTGQDVKVYIEGANDNDNNFSFPCSPFMMLAYSIQQEKMPIYGAWSYTWDAVARGTRIVSGQFTMATTYPNRLVDMIDAAAKTRADKAGIGNGAALRPLRGLDEDERNIQKFWGKNLEKVDKDSKKLFSAHPPFNFVIEYNLQPISSVPTFETPVTKKLKQDFINNPSIYYDVNERLVRADVNQNMSTILEWVELTGCQLQYSPDGDVIAETYSFIAKDEIRPRS